MNKSFLDALLSNQGWGALDPISRAPAYEDDAGNQYAANGSIIRKGIAPGSMTWGETALAGATAPAKFATGLASTLSPYGSEGWQVPPILAEPVRAGNRLLNSGGFPDPQDPQNQQDAVTSLLSFFGANALNPATKLPAGAVGMFAGRKAKTADHAALARAEQMASTGADRNAIWNETGWFQGPDKQWRFEIDDSAAAAQPNANTTKFEIPNLSEGLAHQELYNAYPEMTSVPSVMKYGTKVEGGYLTPDGFSLGLLEAQGPDAPALKSATLHEGQHYIQQQEAFARGGSPESAAMHDPLVQSTKSRIAELEAMSNRALSDVNVSPGRLREITSDIRKSYDDLRMYVAAFGPDAYHRLAGEVEARNVQSRMNMSADQRRATPPWETQDVPDADQIIRLLSDTSRPSVMGSAVGSALDMSAEARMARAKEMGFDTENVLYHGTGKDFQEFDPGTRGNGTRRNIYLTDNPEIADIYANSQNYGLKGGGAPMIYPLYAKAEKPLVVSDKGPDGSFGWVSDNLAAALGVDSPAAGKYATLYDEARRQGYDQVQIREMTDLGGPQTQYIPLRPEYIRSVNAAFDPARAGENGLLLSDNARPSLLGSALAAEQAPTKGITAYHGSPHDFDKFDMSKIGTGEGAQAYGHGLYFAENEGVARSYRDGLSQAKSPMFSARNDVVAYGSVDGALANAQSMVEKGAKQYEPVLKYLQAMKSGVEPDAPGHMYQVRINADPNDFLDWDKPLSQQPASAQEAITKHPAFVPPLSDNPDNFMRNAMRDPETSALLKGAGIPGIKYLDQMSRNAGDGSRNYVVFNQEIIDILKKYGMIPGLYGASQVGQERQ